MTTSQRDIDSHETTTAEAIERKTSFEGQCIDVLCKQENALANLGEIDRKSRNVDSLQLAKKMLLHFLEFAECHLDDEEFKDVSRRLSEVYQRTKDHEANWRRQSWRLFRWFAGLTSPDSMEISQGYQRLRDDYIQLNRDFFAICARRISDDSAMKEQFLQSVEIFVSEIERKW